MSIRINNDSFGIDNKQYVMNHSDGLIGLPHQFHYSTRHISHQFQSAVFDNRPVACVRRCHAIPARIRSAQATRRLIRSVCNHFPFCGDEEPASAFKYAFQRILADDRVLAAATLQPTPASPDLVVFILAGSRILSGEHTTHVRFTAACAEQPPIQFMGVLLLNIRYSERLQEPVQLFRCSRQGSRCQQCAPAQAKPLLLTVAFPACYRPFIQT